MERVFEEEGDEEERMALLSLSSQQPAACEPAACGQRCHVVCVCVCVYTYIHIYHMYIFVCIYAVKQKVT